LGSLTHPVAATFELDLQEAHQAIYFFFHASETDHSVQLSLRFYKRDFSSWLQLRRFGHG